jgi:ribosomal protein L37AE/L43A
MSLGAVNTRTAQRRDSGHLGVTVPRRHRKSSTDRQGRDLSKRNANGRPFMVCPMCSQRASVKYRISGVQTWKCESCNYMDDENGPLN